MVQCGYACHLAVSAILLLTVTVIIIYNNNTLCSRDVCGAEEYHDVLIFLLCSDNAVTFAVALYGRHYVQTSEC